MYGEIITIGDELTAGRTVDLNAWYAAEKIASSGLAIKRVTSVGDNAEMVSEALKRACLTSRFVIVTGGLGSTSDDITSEIVAGAFNKPLSVNTEMLDKISCFVKKRGMKMTPSIEKMANLPHGATLIHPDGAVCGYSLVEKDVHLYFLPGVPDQMRYLMDTFVLPDILSLCDSIPVMKHRVLKIYGLNEPIIAEKLKGLKGGTGKGCSGVLSPFSGKPHHHHVAWRRRVRCFGKPRPDRVRDHGDSGGLCLCRRETGKWRILSPKNSQEKGINHRAGRILHRRTDL